MTGIRTWPWSASATELDAENIFAKTHPAVHHHLKQFETSLRSRQDQGSFWWELRSCDYYDILDAPKIVVQVIAYYSQFALDNAGYVVNDKVVLLPSADLYLLAILNSRVAWWVINRTFQHMKDEGINVNIQYLKKLPIPNASAALRANIVALSQRALVEGVSSQRAALESVTPTAHRCSAEKRPRAGAKKRWHRPSRWARTPSPPSTTSRRARHAVVCETSKASATSALVTPPLRSKRSWSTSIVVSRRLPRRRVAIGER